MTLLCFTTEAFLFWLTIEISTSCFWDGKLNAKVTANIVLLLNPIRYGLFEVLSHMGGGPCGPPLDISAVGP